MIVAKPVIPDRFWILKQDDQKVGNIQATDAGFAVTIGGQVESFKNVRMIKQRVGIDFEPALKTNRKPSNQVHGFDTGCAAYNGIYEVRRQLPLFTKTRKSKSWYAAGWYRVQQNKQWRVMRNPKLITLQRYPYQGPFHNQQEAE
jgi:hypothetical protein